jgi:hypothetical protein
MKDGLSALQTENWPNMIDVWSTECPMALHFILEDETL